MKLWWRGPFFSVLVISGLCLIWKGYFPTHVTMSNTKTRRQINTTSLIISTYVTDKFNKLRAEGRMKKYVYFENMAEFFRKPTKKFYKPFPTNSNHKLSRLLYQLWDPYDYQKQGQMLNCENLVNADERLHQQGRRFARRLNRKFYEYVNVSDILDAIKDTCQPVKNLLKYRTPKFSKASFPIAYTITLDKTAEQSLRMLASIYHHDNVYCVHPNLKFGQLYVNVFKRVAECIPNILLPSKLYSIQLKTINKVKAELDCFEQLLNTSVPWKYGINLPSSAFPLRNNSMMVQYLRNKPYESIVTWEYPNERFMRRVRFSHIIKETEGESLLLRTSVLKPAPPDNVIIYRKGMHFLSTREFYNYLVNSLTAKRFLEWVEDAKSPEDFYYASLYRHHLLPPDETFVDIPFKSRDNSDENVSIIPQNDLLLTLWRSDGAHRCSGQYKGHVCTFGAADLRWLIEQDQLFAYSFDFRIDRVIIDCLSRNLKSAILPDTKYDENDWPTVSNMVRL